MNFYLMLEVLRDYEWVVVVVDRGDVSYACSMSVALGSLLWVDSMLPLLLKLLQEKSLPLLCCCCLVESKVEFVSTGPLSCTPLDLVGVVGPLVRPSLFVVQRLDYSQDSYSLAICKIVYDPLRWTQRHGFDIYIRERGNRNKLAK